MNLPDADSESWLALLYRKYARSLLAYIRLHTSTNEDAEDLMVEVFLVALENEKFAPLPEKAQQACTDQGYFINDLAWSPNGEYLASNDERINVVGKLLIWIAR